MRLSSCRQIGMSEGPIPWTVIEAYCDREEIEGEQRDDMHHHVRSMDAAYLAFKSKKLEEQSKQTQKQPRQRGSRRPPRGKRR